MTAKLQVCFDIDLPTGLERILNQQVEKKNMPYRVFMPGHVFMKEFPALMPYMVSQQYNQFDIVLTVTPKEYVEEMAEPVAQQAAV